MAAPPPGGQPADHERTFRVRHYECDAYGHLNNTAYLRYLEEVELDAGFVDDVAAWPWARARITYGQPLGFGDAVMVSARDAGLAAGGRLRRYDYSRVGDGTAIASAEVLWRAASTASAPPSLSVPGSGAARPFVQRRTVEWRDVDQSLSVSPATMAEYAEACGLALLADFGWPLARCSAAGFAMVLRSHDVTYGRLPGLGDELTVTTWASDATRVSATRHYVFGGADGETPARFASRYVWLDLATMRPMRIPADFLGDFAENFVAS